MQRFCCLAAYSGWEDIDFEANAVQLSTHFSDDEIEALKSLPMYPYSLSQSVSHILENILRFAGFTAGNTLLYGTGNGSLLRALPEKMVKESRITIAATDALNGALNSFLAPETEVVFCEDAMRESYYDAALALIPIYPQGTSIVAGRRKGEIELPNYAASMLRIFSAVRPGGFAILIMESQNPYDEADLRYTPFKLSSSPLQFIGGLRLANDAFADGRCYDILVFHKTGKKVAPEDSQFAGCPSLWEYFTNTPDDLDKFTNQYVARDRSNLEKEIKQTMLEMRKELSDQYENGKIRPKYVSFAKDRYLGKGIDDHLLALWNKSNTVKEEKHDMNEA